MKIREIQCKSAIGKCGFPGGGWSINPYVGCEHACEYCYARFMKRFTNHEEPWGEFVDVRVNIPEVLKKELKSDKYKGETIYIGTVTDPYQQAEKKYKLTRKILEELVDYPTSVSILTKSDLILRDLDLIKKFKKIDVNFTFNTLDEQWRKRVEPNSSTSKERLNAMKKLSDEGVSVYAMVGPYWPFFTDPEKIFKELKKAGVRHAFSESFNTTGSNFVGVEKVLKKYYSDKLVRMKEIFFDSNLFYDFYVEAEQKLKDAFKRYNIPVTIYFRTGHTGKFKR
ncbi:radical SAM protein [Patescibacteria group bacterium]|nr:radical SAM protein [Patescibacteria group bacterium]MBU1952726.1 radical SAM protein [Patescibacteria group bacterium]